ncbi:MAG TPA: SH3 domain-containing protein [Gemmatimonadales bacterium]|nr:SH3 domain-containing protein [Gemmatimonadales bacterium]
MTLRNAGIGLVFLGVAACQKPATQPDPKIAADTGHQAPARDPEQDRRIAQLELQNMERDAEVEALQQQLDDARAEVVRAMAKVSTLATRAEAASNLAEAQVAVQTLKTNAGTAPLPELASANQMLRQASTEFDKGNYGGVVYLSNQAKNFASEGQTRLSSVDRSTLRAGEIPFAIPLSLHTTGHANIRSGPGTTFKVAYTLESGADVTAFSYVDEWVRITDSGDRTGWIHRTLISRRAAGAR